MEHKEILIVDEQFPMLENVKRILQDQGYSVLPAPDALSALEELPGHRFDLIMVSLNGYEKDKLNLLKWAGRYSAQSKLIVVGYAKVTLPMDVFQIKVDDYILPPFTAVELSTRVDRCLNGNKVVPELDDTGCAHGGNVVHSPIHEILHIHNGLLSLEANFHSFIDQEINIFNSESIDKIYKISHELYSLINISENILYTMLTCYCGKDHNSMGAIFPQGFFQQNKITHLH